MPKTLSVYMRNYNYGQYIGEALDAIFSQSFSPSEVIVIDDASTDNSISVIESFMRKHPNLRLLRNEKNMGVVYCMNRGIEAAAGDYVYGAASDDRVLPGFFEKSMDLLMKYPHAGLCYTDIALLFDNNSMVDKRCIFIKKPCYFPPHETIKLFLKFPITPILSNTVIAKRRSLTEAGGYRPQLKWACDLFAHNVISFREGFCYIPEVLAVTRVHKFQYGRTMFGKWHLDREVIENIIITVKKPQYAEVLSAFKKTAGFSQSPWEVLRVVAGKREYWDFLSLKLLKFAFLDMIKRIIKFVLPPFLFDLLRDMVYKVRQYRYYIWSKFKGL